MFTLSKIFSGGDSEVRSAPKNPNKRQEFYQVKSGSNYEVSVDITGDAPYSTCVMSVNAVTGGDRKLPIAARFSWKKFSRGPEEDINVTSNTLHASPLDSGYYIKVYITPIEEDNIYQEVSTVVFGPIVLDPMIKRTLQGIMRAGGFKFQVERVMLPESEEHGSDGMIMLSHNYLQIIARKNPNHSVKVMLTERFKIASQRNQFKTFALELPDDTKSGEIAKMFGIPKTRNFRKLKFVLSSINTKDLLILSINIFKSLQQFKDAEIFNLVTQYMKDADENTPQRRRHPEEESFDEDYDENTLADNPFYSKDPIDQLFLNNGLKDEIFKLYNNNKELALERNKLQMKVVNLESELTRSMNQKPSDSEYGGTPKHQEPSQPDVSVVDQNKIQLIRQKNSEITANIGNIEAANDQLKAEIARFTKIFKQMRYKELMESKLNATANKAPEKDISNLELALNDYAKEYQKIMEQLGAQPNNMLKEDDSDRSLSMVDEMEERALEILMKNERLKDEIQRYRELIYELEKKSDTAGNRNFAESFADNESFLKPKGGLRNEARVEFEIKIENLDNRIKRLTLENTDLQSQIKELREKLAEQEDNDQEVKIFRKLKMQNVELKSILETKKQKIHDLQKIKIALQDQELDTKATTIKLAENTKKKIEDMKFRKEQLEMAGGLLQKELEEQKKKAQQMEEEHRNFMRQSTIIASPHTPGNKAQQIEKMRLAIKDMEEKIGVLEKKRQEEMTQPQLTKAELQAFEDEKKMNEKLVGEIIRLNEIIRKNNRDRDISIL